jgi:hypothetical protein
LNNHNPSDRKEENIRQNYSQKTMRAYYTALAVAVLLFEVRPAAGQTTGTRAAAYGTSDRVQYVSTSGDEGNPGTDPGHAKLTPEGALKALSSGGTVHVAAGTYTVAGRLPTPSAPIDFDCDDGPLETVIKFTITSGAAFSPWYGSKIHGCDIRGNYHSSSTIGINGGAAAWAPSTAYTTANNNISPTYANANGHIYQETAPSCTSGSSEPEWTVTPGATVTDNSCLWQEEGPLGVEVYGNIVEGFGLQQINIGGNNGWWNIHDNFFRGGYSAGRPEAEDILVGLNSQKNIISHNHFSNSPTDGVDINGGRNIVDGNVMTKIGLPGGEVDRECVTIVSVATGTNEVSDNIISNNVCDQTGGPAIFMQGQDGAPAMNRNKIIGNTILGPSGSGLNGDCITIDGGSPNQTSYDGNEIIGNTCLDPQRWGISVHAGKARITNTRVIGNMVKGSGAGDMDLFDETNTVISGNQFESSTPVSSSGGGALWRDNDPGPVPSISSGFGTSPSILEQSGPEQFEVNVGTDGTATSGVIGLPAAPHGWACQAADMDTNVVTRETAFTTTTVTFTAAGAWKAGDKLLVNCGAF